MCELADSADWASSAFAHSKAVVISVSWSPNWQLTSPVLGMVIICFVGHGLVWGLSYIVSSLGVAIVMLTSQVLDLASNGVEQG